MMFAVWPILRASFLQQTISKWFRLRLVKVPIEECGPSSFILNLHRQGEPFVQWCYCVAQLLATQHTMYARKVSDSGI